MTKLLIKNGDAVFPEFDETKRADVLTENGTIKAIGTQIEEPTDQVIDASDCYVSPGFIDMQVNGGAGVDLLQTDAEGLKRFADLWVSTGATGYLGTVITEPITNMRNAVELLANADLPGLWGVHVEGPFLSREKRGTHNPEHLRSPTLKRFHRLTSGLEETIKLFTFAPELEGGEEILNRLLEVGIVPSLGHTNASYQEALEAIGSGASCLTHLFNGMSTFHHRSPGCVGAAFDSSAYVGLISDGRHVHPTGLRMARKLKGKDRICLVTDAIAAAGMDDGEYDLGDQKIIVTDGLAKLPTGTLAGSTLTMNRAVANFREFTGAGLPEAVRMASLNPATMLGLEDRKGSLAAGKDADLVVFTEELEVTHAIIEGELVYST
ncbi:MAG: N-acetylglucosamine-6-phosphate deacetylase [Candidatus Acetothermia bacterium]